MAEKETRLEKIVRGMVKKQCLRIIYKDLKKYNHYQIHNTIKKIYIKSFADIETIYFPVAMYYRKEKKRLQTKLLRIKQNKTISGLKQKYPNIDIELLTYYISVTDILNFKTPKHYEHLEQIVKIILALVKEKSLENSFRDFKYIKNIQEQNELINVSYLASYINSFKGFRFKSKAEAEHLSNIIDITLSVSIAMKKQLKFRSWQTQIKINMENQNEIIMNEIKRNILTL